MIRKTISMPDEMGAWIEARVKSGQYGNDSEYLRDLVRRDQERTAATVRFQTLLDEGMASGVSEATMEEIWGEAMRRRKSKSS